MLYTAKAHDTRAQHTAHTVHSTLNRITKVVMRQRYSLRSALGIHGQRYILSCTFLFRTQRAEEKNKRKRANIKNMNVDGYYVPVHVPNYGRVVYLPTCSVVER